MEPSRCLPFFFPTRVAFVDDERSFLSILLSRLQLGLPVATYDSARAFLADLEQERVTATLNTEWWTYSSGLTDSSGMIDSSARRQVVALNRAKIHKQVFDTHRFDTISVVVADYDMPDMSGLSLCRALAGLPCKKILLTGNTDSAMVTQAFNQGLVDLYVPKFHPKLELELTTAIRHFQLQYMVSASERVAERMRPIDPFIWSDRVFSKFFHRFCVDHGIVEFYAVDDPRGFLLVDKAARGRLMLLLSTTDIHDQYVTAMAARAPLAVISALRAKERVLYFPQRRSLETLTPLQWGACCIQARPLPGREDRYYALAPSSGPFQVSPNTVLGLEQYLRRAV